MFYLRSESREELLARPALTRLYSGRLVVQCEGGGAGGHSGRHLAAHCGSARRLERVGYIDFSFRCEWDGRGEWLCGARGAVG